MVKGLGTLNMINSVLRNARKEVKMALSCGCEISPGGPVSLETLKAHYKHTIECLLFWELLKQKNQNPEARYSIDSPNMKLSQARIDLIEAINELYPEARQD